MNKLENISRGMPGGPSDEQFEALRERIRLRTTARMTPRPRMRRIYAVAATAAAVVALVAGVFVARYPGRPDPVSEPGFEQLLSTTPAETLQQAAAENYDDIFDNQQL